MSDYWGEFAGIGTSVCWSFTSILFTLSGRKVGSQVVNRTRLLMAVLMVSLLHFVTQGAFLPIHAPLWRWGYMGLSGIIGFVLGDAMLFEAFVMIGPRLTMLLMALSPVMGAAIAWIFLGEELAALEIVGILLAVSGVAWVVTAPRDGKQTGLPEMPRRFYVMGVLLGLGAALGQAGGLVFSKLGLRDDFPALSGNMMRLVVASVTIWLITLFQGQVRANFKALHANPRAVYIMFAGAIFGPFVGVWLSLIAVQNTAVGVASTLTSLAPIILIPLSWLLFKERITGRAVAGTALAMAGTVILFWA
ncbi:MAG TPA: DMT family transporter [Aggregatilineaceae bacterium]|nr:DMT family transporter [Aggregatilineaceae bacterium]